MELEQPKSALDAKMREAIGKALRVYFDSLKAETPDRLLELVRTSRA
jgi:hypothetical protein